MMVIGIRLTCQIEYTVATLKVSSQIIGNAISL